MHPYQSYLIFTQEYFNIHQNNGEKGKKMKYLVLSILSFLTSSAAFSADYYFRNIQCSGWTNRVSFWIERNYPQKTFHGSGTEDYLNYELNCSELTDDGQIFCISPENRAGRETLKKISVVISVDKENIITAIFDGVYEDRHHNLKIGCISWK